MTSATSADLVVEAGFYYEWTTSRSPLARKLTNYQTVPDSSIPSRQLPHGTTLVGDLIRSLIYALLTKNKCGPNTGFAYFETSNPENIPLETLRSEFPFVFSRTVSGPST